MANSIAHRTGRRSRLQELPFFAVIALLLAAFGLALTSAIQKSPTMDEQNHIARGAAYLGTGDPRLSVEHPPVINVLSALPAHLLLDLQLPLDEWWEVGEWYHFADSFLWRTNDHPDRIVFLARLPIIGLVVLLISLVFRWASSSHGRWGALLAASFVAFDPNVLAHGRLSTTDLGGAFFVFLAAYAFWRLSQCITLAHLVAAGVTLGLAFASKLSALAFGPVLGLAFVLEPLVGGKKDRVWPPFRRLGLLALAAAIASLVVWASYGFSIGPVEGFGARVPAPPYVRGLLAVFDLAGGGRPAYLMGQLSNEGWWYYFPVAFLVKTPVPTLLGLLLATGMLLFRPRSDDLFLCLPPLVFFLATTTTRLNLGYRHLLPLLPFLATHIGRIAQFPAVGSRGIRCPRYLLWRLVPAILGIWLAISCLAIYPHYLAYFNAIGGGPDNGWRILVDSNIDWGQDLKGLRRWMEMVGVERVNLAWFGSAPPEAYGIDHQLLPGVPHGFNLWQEPPFDRHQPEPGVYAISVTNLVGAILPDPDLYAWFRQRVPDQRIGHSIFIYRVPAP